MSRLLLLIAVLLSGVGYTAHASGQDVQSAVISICREVALEEVRVQGRGHPLSGQCIAATEVYLGAIATVLTQEELDLAVADLVVALAELLLTPQCVLESEIVDATLIARSRSADPFQQQQLLLIADTLRACDFVVTAAITTLNTNAPFDSDANATGNSASHN